MNVQKMLKDLLPQANEFDAMARLAKAYKNLPAIVDDDYPECRHKYESAVKDFLAACKANGRSV